MKFSGCFIALLVSGYCRAVEYRFSPSMVGDGGGNVDISLFNRGGQLPGTYPVDILLNGSRVDSRNVAFSLVEDSGGKPVLAPCLSRDELSRYGIRVEDFSPPAEEAGPSGGCFQLSIIPGARADFLFSDQVLQLSVPQVYVRPEVRGIAPQTLWDDGIPALLMNYQASVTRTTYRGAGHRSDSTSWVQLSPGLNLGAWRVRNITNWQRSGGQKGQWQTVSTRAERGLYGWKSRLTLGEHYTPSDIFDSVPFRGAMLSSDDSMVPGSLYAFAPVVRGVARTQARVEVRQSGYTLYDGVVAPGPFALTDLAPSGSGGDLEVTVWETDGSPQTFTVPWQTPAIALKEGYLRYNVTGGQYRSTDASTQKSPFIQATAMYGLPWNLTVYGGLQAAEYYHATTAGLGVSMGSWGALSLDITEGSGRRRNAKTEKGHALKLRYSKQFMSTRTTFAASSYQYASSGFSTLSDVLDTYGDTGGRNVFSNRGGRRKNRSGLTLSQPVGSRGTFTFSGYRESYWGRAGHDDTVSAGWSFPVSRATVSLNFSQSQHTRQSGNQTRDRTTSLWVSMPLGGWLGGDTSASYRYTRALKNGSSHSLGVNGSAMDRRLNWAASQQYRPDHTGDRNNGALNTAWSGAYGQVSGNYSYSDSFRQVGAGVEGGIVVHRNGVTAGQALGDTTALVKAPGASGVQVGSWPGVRTDFRGYTTLANLQPYQENTVSLNPTELPDNVDISGTDIRVVPTQGAVVPAAFITRMGARALVNITQSDGKPIPYGAVVTLTGQEDEEPGIAGTNGQTYLTGLPDQGTLVVKWAGHQCLADYRLPFREGAAGLHKIKALCR